MINSFSAIDLFCGAGGRHIGFEEAGFDIKLCVDNNNLVEKTHRRNFPNIPMINRDISQITIEEIEDYCGDCIDIIIGGPPCQGFSTIEKEYRLTRIREPKKTHIMNWLYLMQRL